MQLEQVHTKHSSIHMLASPFFPLCSWSVSVCLRCWELFLYMYCILKFCSLLSVRFCVPSFFSESYLRSPMVLFCSLLFSSVFCSLCEIVSPRVSSSSVTFFFYFWDPLCLWLFMVRWEVAVASSPCSVPNRVTFFLQSIHSSSFSQHTVSFFCIISKSSSAHDETGTEWGKS